MDPSQYKEDALTLPFMKSVSDKYKGGLYGMIVVPEETSFDGVMARLKLATDDDGVAELKQARKLFDAETVAKKFLVQELGKKVADHLKVMGMKV
ncbi:hypothetical protein [Granulosicoccus antarcticus]|uniref:Uncharacterized protein n=1 Tax=Granulosicoccus antarcticus IMCC3135 TaxID=1192854 RepID=A0A2Z2NVG4_9GAMM|nr:hypothetical protein [Granulosicoccus antarcticus]ASJ72780.1 hypothetical protein IMCC3135_13475 [Granulosicoccus antarcticus IMCC3135]